MSRFTDYHAAWWAHSLTMRGGGHGIGGLAQSLGNARVDLNPHQVDAALFAVRSPLNTGVILADEVGLGKTIEAGLVIAQRWAERRRRILIIVPATLRKQWQQELAEKFGLDAAVVDAGVIDAARRARVPAPLGDAERIVICSYNFVAQRLDDFRSVPWDLVVLDEAHRLRNVYRSSARMARAVVGAVGGRPKLLLTATPLQNSLLELYGLVSIADPHVFGDEETFRDRFTGAKVDVARRNVELKERLAPLCTRTLRKQVLEYIRFTRRIPVTQEFSPSDEEQELYDLVSEYLRRDSLVALPVQQRALMTLVLRKLLASSSFAIAATLERMVARLERDPCAPLELGDDFEELDDVADEWDGVDALAVQHPGSAADALRVELEELREYARRARGIGQNAKGAALLSVLDIALRQAVSLGAGRKAVVFTESRRTQEYLVRLLEENGYAGEVVVMNGGNADPGSRAIFEAWKERHGGDGARSGARSADVKAAIVEEFRDRATILVATESAAEGVNLQFASLVVNFDLPWNPQRVEQRIGRCHRYGQKHDVVVVNFLNRRNAADQRVHELLASKFRLFDGVFGASDEVLGAIESGVDVERRIAAIYQECRTADEIDAAFGRLQAELDAEIADRLAETRRNVLEHFDADVQKRLQVRRREAMDALEERQAWLLQLALHELGDDARELPGVPAFLHPNPDTTDPPVPAQCYCVAWERVRDRGGEFLSTDHPLAQRLIDRALARSLPVGTLALELPRGRAFETLHRHAGQGGWLAVARLAWRGMSTEERLLVAALDEHGAPLPTELAAQLLELEGTASSCAVTVPAALTGEVARQAAAARTEIERREARFLDEEEEKLERWAEDLRRGVELRLRAIKDEIEAAKRESRLAATLADKVRLQERIRALEKQERWARQEIFTAQDEIDERRDAMIGDLRARLGAAHTVDIVWSARFDFVER